MVKKKFPKIAACCSSPKVISKNRNISDFIDDEFFDWGFLLEEIYFG